MDTMPIIGAPLHWPPWALSALLFVITPGAHLLLSPLVERRRVTWRDDYLAVLVGDPLLAVAAGIGLAISGGHLHLIAGWPFGLMALIGGVAFGRWQVRAEVAEGRYDEFQAVSPTKLWHQYVVYPVLGYLVPAAVLSGLARARPAAALALIGLLAAWTVLTTHAIRHPRVGHGGFDWRTRRAVAPLSKGG